MRDPAGSVCAPGRCYAAESRRAIARRQGRRDRQRPRPARRFPSRRACATCWCGTTDASAAGPRAPAGRERDSIATLDEARARRLRRSGRRTGRSDRRSLPDVELHDAAAAAPPLGDDATLADRLDAVRARRRRSGRSAPGAGRSPRASPRACRHLGGIRRVEASGTSVGWHVRFNGEIGDGLRRPARREPTEFHARLARLASLAAGARARRRTGHGSGVAPVLLAPASRRGLRRSETLLEPTWTAPPSPTARAHFRARAASARTRRCCARTSTLRARPARAACGRVVPLHRRGRSRRAAALRRARPARASGARPQVRPPARPRARRRCRRPWTRCASRARRDLVRRGARAAAGGALVLSVLGVHTQDPTSGDFSLVGAPGAAHRSGSGSAGACARRSRATCSTLLRRDDLAFVAFEGEHTPGLLARCRVDPPDPGAGHARLDSATRPSHDTGARSTRWDACDSTI